MTRRIASAVLLAVILAAGCTSRSPRPAIGGNLVRDPEVPRQAPPANASYLFSDSPEVQEAMALYAKTGKAPIIKGEGFVQFPCGQTEPLITCLPLRACDVELEPGEEILNVALGDSERWIAQPAESGGKGVSTPHLVIKPTDFNLMSNALVFTSRRTYHIALLAPPEGMTPAAYARRVGFYYPSELVQRVGRSLADDRRTKDSEVAKLPTLTASTLTFDYKVSGSNTGWRPIRAFDDGAHVYIQMPDTMKADEAPALMVSTSDGDTLVNYRVKGRFYVVDKLFDEAYLVSGTGWNQERVTIKYTGRPRS